MTRNGANNTDSVLLDLLRDGPACWPAIGAATGLAPTQIGLLISQVAKAGHDVRVLPGSDRRAVVVRFPGKLD